ncbi:MAG: D-alanyl-D-alanine carboxypeptidase family protein [Chlamydiales bacterium]
MRAFTKQLFFFGFFLLSRLSAESLSFNVSGEHIILVNGKTGAILFERNAHVPTYPASTTKIATALYLLHLRDDALHEKATTKPAAIASITPQAKRESNYRSPAHWLEVGGTHIGLKRGEEMPLYDLLHGILLASANDACNVVAEEVGGNIPKFMDDLNAYLEKLGCKNTHFCNPHGLTHPDHKTTPYDLALMAREGMKHPLFREIVAKSRYTCPETNLEYRRYFIQTNRLLRNGAHFYSKAVGIKTGSTQAAGVNLVAAAEEGGRLLIAVLLNYGSTAELYHDAKELFETTFAEPQMRLEILPKGEQDITKKIVGTRKRLQTYLPDGLYYDYYPSEKTDYKVLLHWSLSPLPIQKGEKVGMIELVAPDKTVLQSAPLFAYQTLYATVTHRFAQFFFHEKKGRMLLFSIAILPTLLFLWRLVKK